MNTSKGECRELAAQACTVALYGRVAVHCRYQRMLHFGHDTTSGGVECMLRFHQLHMYYAGYKFAT